ncbi:MAG: alpha/beta hydrolase [Chloroflexi bacterium]|nr:alpha/beta hydrolase [Chloroflexota bacterium]
MPQGKEPNTGLVFYQGGRIDPRSYAPTAYDIASAGFLVIIVPMPLNLAILTPDRAMEVINQFDEIDTWIISGHSLGGSMAATVADDHQKLIDGIIFWASYPTESDNLNNDNVSTLSLYGTNDRLATLTDIAHALLPDSTTWAPVLSKNHAQFGWYGTQSGDNPATITRTEQQQRIVAETVNSMTHISNNNHD